MAHRGWCLKILIILILIGLVFPVPPASAQAEPQLSAALSKQLQEFQEKQQQAAAALQELQQAAVAFTSELTTHKTALSLQQLPVDQAKELTSYYLGLATQWDKTLSSLEKELEQLQKLHKELQAAREKLQTALAQAPLPRRPGRAATDPLLTQRRQLELTDAALKQLTELQRLIQARRELLHQQHTSARELATELQDYVDRKLKAQLLERQQPTALLDQVQGVLQATSTLISRLGERLREHWTSGAVTLWLRQHLAELAGLLILLGILLYLVKWLRRATKELRARLAAGAVTFSLKLAIALSNALARKRYLLAVNLWLALALWTLGLLTHSMARLAVYGLLALLIVRLLQQLLWSVFEPQDLREGIILLPPDSAHYYTRYGGLTFLTLVGGQYFLYLLRLLAFPEKFLGLVVLVYLVIMIFWFAWLLRRPHLENLLAGVGLHGSWLANLLRFLRWFIFFLLFLIICLDLLGFQNLALYLAGATFWSAMMLAGAWFLSRLGEDINDFLTHPETGYLARTLELAADNLASFHAFIARFWRGGVRLLALGGILWAWGLDWGSWRTFFAILSWGPTLGPVTLSPLALLLAGFSLYGAVKLSRFSRQLLETRLYQRRDWDIGIQSTISSIVHYCCLFVGLLLALSFLGLNLANLAIIMGGLGVGIGFGLQNIVNNFISGLILLFERPIKVGDMLVIDGQWGEVKAIRVRSTIFETFDRYVMIIPNSELLSSKIINWTYFGRKPNRLTLKVGVSYNADVELVTQLLTDVCLANPRVLSEPAPRIFFTAFGDSSLDFNVWVYVREPADRIPATHELNQAILTTLRAHGVEIPYPQRDLHLKTPVAVIWPPQNSSA